ncbi:hypothetical protein [Nitrosopumilus sp. b3]|nr:hypothetical protein [Nitrosopumilus sp. b3]
MRVICESGCLDLSLYPLKQVLVYGDAELLFLHDLEIISKTY